MSSLYRSYGSEDEEQAVIFTWAELHSGVYPCLSLMYHVPNEGKRSRAAAVKLKRMGLRRGVPDICLPVARGGYHGLYIELKVGKNRATADQKAYLEALGREGYFVALCYGALEAEDVILRYVRGEVRI